jgi:hypothetical protein
MTRQEAIDFINAAPDQAERNRRKNVYYVLLNMPPAAILPKAIQRPVELSADGLAQIDAIRLTR